MKRSSKQKAHAKRGIVSETAGADSTDWGLSQTSFLQIKSGRDFSSFEAVRLTQLASALNSGTDVDLFATVKGLIPAMMVRFETDTTEKALSDKKLSETNNNLADKNKGSAENREKNAFAEGESMLRKGTVL